MKKEQLALKVESMPYNLVRLLGHKIHYHSKISYVFYFETTWLQKYTSQTMFVKKLYFLTKKPMLVLITTSNNNLLHQHKYKSVYLQMVNYCLP